MARSKVIENLAYGRDAVCRTTGEGKAIDTPYRLIWSDDPNESSSKKRPVQDATNLLHEAKKQPVSEGTLIDVAGLQKNMDEMKEGLTNLQNYIADRAEIADGETQQQKSDEQQAKTKQLETDRVVQNLQHARGALLSAGYVFQITGDYKNAHIAFGVADMRHD